MSVIQLILITPFILITLSLIKMLGYLVILLLCNNELVIYVSNLKKNDLSH